MLPIPKRQFRHLEDTLKITVSPHQSSIGNLKVGLRELGLNQKISNPHIDFGVVLPPTRKRRSWPHPKLRNL